MLHTILHVVKFVPEVLCLGLLVLAVVMFVSGLTPSSVPPDEGEVYMDLFIIILCLLGALVNFFIWFALVHFGRLPWWL